MLFAGIDGGATASVGHLVDENGHRVARAVGGPTNHHTVGTTQVEHNLFALLDDLLGGPDGPVEETRFCFALAGLWRSTDRQIITEMLARHGIAARSILVSDAEAVLGMVEEAVPAVAVIAGTGSVVLGRDAAGRIHKVGGGGHLLDDEGSGYRLGLDALRAITEAEDGRGPQTTLAERLLPGAGLAGTGEIIAWLYELPELKTTVAALAPLVIDTAAAGDPIAAQIIENGAEGLARWARVAVEQLDMTDQAPRVLLSGGVLERSDFYRRLVTDRITAQVEGSSIRVPEQEPASGAARLAYRAWAARQ